MTAIEHTRFRKLADRSYQRGRLVGSLWAVQVKVSGHRSWITIGQVKGMGRRWSWQCEAAPTEGRRTGREASRAEARTALLAHVRTGNHDHISRHTRSPKHV